MRRNRTAVFLSLALFVTLLCRHVPAPAVSDTYDWFEGATGYEEVRKLIASEGASVGDSGR